MTKNVYIHCEGQSEEQFIKRVLGPYLLNHNVCAVPIICSTKRTPDHSYKGESVHTLNSKGNCTTSVTNIRMNL